MPMSMTKAILRWAVPLTGLLFVGPLAGLCTLGLRASDGSHAVTPILADSPIMGLIRGIASLLIAGAFGAVATRINGLKSGLFTTGLVLAWATWGTGNMDDIIRRTQSTSTLWKLGGEGVLFGVLAVGLAIVLTRLHQQRLRAAAPATPSMPGSATVAQRAGVRKAMLSTLGVALPAMGVIVWIVATEPLKGQAFAAATAASMLGVIAGSWANRGGSSGVPIFTFFAAAALFAAASPVAATFYHGTEPILVRSSLAGTLFPLARLVPLDWIAGAFVGVPMGLSMAGWTTDHLHHEKHS